VSNFKWICSSATSLVCWGLVFWETCPILRLFLLLVVHCQWRYLTYLRELRFLCHRQFYQFYNFDPFTFLPFRSFLIRIFRLFYHFDHFSFEIFSADEFTSMLRRGSGWTDRHWRQIWNQGHTPRLERRIRLSCRYFNALFFLSIIL
jgi:hypothetical protein